MRNTVRLTLAAVAMCALSAGSASAAPSLQMVTYSGNDCSGVFGKGFDNCSIEGSPIVIKFNQDGTGTEVNSIFDSIDGSEFTFTPVLSGSVGSGTFTYNPDDPEDPAIRFWVAKQSNGFNLFYWGEAGDLGSAVPIVAGTSYAWNTNGFPSGLSHMSFYDTMTPPGEEEPPGEGEEPGTGTPEPTVMSLFGLALLGAAYRARRRQ
jgi:hypothetical protein